MSSQKIRYALLISAGLGMFLEATTSRAQKTNCERPTLTKSQEDLFNKYKDAIDSQTFSMTGLRLHESIENILKLLSTGNTHQAKIEYDELMAKGKPRCTTKK